MILVDRPVRFVLVAPSHPGNIGAAARAIRTMGFRALQVVAPRDPAYRSHPEAVALATGAADVLAASVTHADLTAALADTTRAYALSGYDRQFGPPLIDLRAAAADAAAHLAALPASANGAPAGGIAFVFGTERSGLENVDVERCNACVAIPADPGFASLNLAQAVQVTAYELQLALRASAAVQAGQVRFAEADAPAALVAVEHLYAHLEQALVSIGYLRPEAPGHLMARLRRLLNRAQPTQAEIDVLRGVCAAIIEVRRDRVGRKQAARAADPADPADTIARSPR